MTMMPSPALPLSLTSWDDRGVEKMVTVGGKQEWRYVWFETIFKIQHVMRSICHLLKISGKHIAMCKASIPAADLERYRFL
jgi:hypothetical protein